jgi:hypothetical protein
METEMTRFRKMPAARAAVSALGVGLVLATSLNPAQAYADPTACTGLCITDIRQDGARLHVAWTGARNWAYYLVSWHAQGSFPQPGQRVSGDQFGFDIPDVQPGSTYVVEVSGCDLTTPFWQAGPCG